MHLLHEKSSSNPLTKDQFDLLVLLIENKKLVTCKDIANELKVNEGLISKLVKDLNSLELIEQLSLTKKGIDVLENYKVQRAVFIAAGFGSRMIPITLNTPKPLVRVHGTRLIDTSLDALVAIGITEVYIVRGHLAEQFDQLLYKYPGVKFIENPAYNEANSIMSAVYAKDLFKRAYVLDADLCVQNPKIFKKYQFSSNYLGFPVERTDDWCFNSVNGYIESIAHGGVNCHQWVGISYWTEEDGKKLESDLIKKIALPGGKEVFWDEVPLVSFKDNYSLTLTECNKEDVVELDSFRELKAFDRAYDV